MKLLISLFLANTLLWSCSTSMQEDEKAPEGYISIQGHLENSSYDTLYLKKLYFDKIEEADTIITDSNGSFSSSLAAEQSKFYILADNNNNFVRILLDKGARIRISADINNFAQSFHSEGSHNTQLLRDIEAYGHQASLRVDSLLRIVNAQGHRADFNLIFPSLDSAYRENYNNTREYFERIIRNNMTSLASVVAIYHTLDNQSLFNEFNAYDLFQELSDSLFNRHPHNSFAIHLKNRAAEMRQSKKHRERLSLHLQPGLQAPEFTIINQSGEAVSLSSFRGQYLLLKFWDSHCDICHRENMALKQIFDTYKDKGLEVLAVSVDTDRSDWMTYLANHNFNWQHAWYYDRSETYNNAHLSELYYLEIIPVTHLIDTKGYFVAVDVKSSELERLLKERLQ